MLLMQQQILSSSLPQPNTFIGGVGNTVINNVTELASKFSFDAVDVKNFQIDVNNNVSFYIANNFSINGNTLGFDNTPELTYIVAIRVIFSINAVSLRSCANLKILQGVNNFAVSSPFRYSNPIQLFSNTNELIGDFGFQNNSSLKYIYFPNATATTLQCFLFTSNALRFYLPSVTFWYWNGEPGASFRGSNPGAKIYIRPEDFITVPDALVYARDTVGMVLVSVDDFTPPSAVTDLSASSITSSGCNLDFTPPSSTNALDFYEVWIENIDLGEWQLDRVVGRYSINQEITASGDTISGLTTGTNYKIWIVACDEYWNRSAISNVIEITTL